MNYGIALAEGLKARAGFLEQNQISNFVGWGNIYRGITRTGLTIPDCIPISEGSCTMQPLPGVTTPYNSGPFTEMFSSLVVSGFWTTSKVVPGPIFTPLLNR